MSAPPGWEPWHRLPNEGELGFATFQQYLALSVPRDLRRLAKGSALTYSQIESMAWEWSWSDRARLWDDHLDTIRRTTIERITEEKAIEVAERQLKLLVAMQRLAAKETEKLLTVTAANDAIGTITPRDIVRMAGVGVRLERLVRGEVTERTAIGPDLAALSVEDLRALRAAQAKAGVR